MIDFSQEELTRLQNNNSIEINLDLMLQHPSEYVLEQKVLFCMFKQDPQKTDFLPQSVAEDNPFIGEWYEITLQNIKVIIYLSHLLVQVPSVNQKNNSIHYYIVKLTTHELTKEVKMNLVPTVLGKITPLKNALAITPLKKPKVIKLFIQPHEQFTRATLQRVREDLAGIKALGLAKMGRTAVELNKKIIRGNSSLLYSYAKFFVTMYEVGNCDLNVYIKKHKIDKSLNFTVKIFLLLAKELQKLHKKNIIHADIKPCNIRIMLNKITMDIEKVYLIDGGTVRQLATSTMEDLMDGTGSYVSPDKSDAMVAKNEKELLNPNLQKSNDIWALGCVIYEFITGLSNFHSIAERLNRDFWSFTLIFSDHDPEDTQFEAFVTLFEKVMAARFNLRPTIDELIANLEVLQIKFASSTTFSLQIK